MGFKPKTKKSNKPVKKSNFLANFNKALIKSNLIEQKRHRGYINASVSTTASLVSLLNGNTQGVGDLNTRMGDSISLTKLEFHYSALLADTTNIVRLIIFLYADNNVVAPVAGDIFDDTATNMTQLFGPINEDNLKSKRLKILVDKRITLRGQKNYIGGSIIKDLSKPYEITFSGGSSSVGRNMPYMLLLSDSAIATHPTFDSYYTMHYTDL